MAGSTSNYYLAYFDFGDTLDAPLNIQREVDRFTLIDRQLFAMATIFGDGVIDGWEVTESDGLSIEISPGIGIVDGLACQTSFSELIENLPSNSVIYVYVDRANTTPEDRSIRILSNTTEPSQGILLATVVTSGLNIESIDNDVRSIVGFRQQVLDEIALHRHGGDDCGGTQAPKIDLTQEVQGLLPISHIADIDARKITGARLPESVVPTLDHSTLRNIGQLSHAQLDSIVQSIQKDNISLLGEVDAINLMKLIIDRKYDKANVDQYFENELAIIPGVSVDDHIDWENTTAYVNTVSNCISGIPDVPEIISEELEGGGGENTNHFEIVTVRWETDDQFNEAVVLDRLTISDGVKLSVDTVADRAIETFDEGSPGDAVANYTGGITESSTVEVVYDNSAAQGSLAARFEHVNSRTLTFTKAYTSPQDWSVYDHITVFVKNSGATHAAVFMSFYDNADTLLKTVTLLDRDEVTTTDPDAVNYYSRKAFDISDMTKTQVMKVVIYTDTITNQEEAFYIDTIYLSTSQFLQPSGSLRLRYSTAAPVIFNSIDYDAEIPQGTALRVRVRTASSENGLATATFSTTLNPDDVFSYAGTHIEIDFQFEADPELENSPLLTYVGLVMLAPSDVSGLAINTADAWNRGNRLTNISVSDEGVVTMLNTNVGNIYFANENQISELNTALVPVVGVGAQYMPISPAQAQNAIDPPTETEDPDHLLRRDTRGLYNPRSVYRTDEGNFMIADTGNDRIIEMQSDGTFVRGFGSHNFNYGDGQTYALTAVYNPRLGTLFITLSNLIDVQNFDLSDITLGVGLTQTIRLNNESDKSKTLKGEILPPRLGSDQATTGRLDRTLAILLSLDKREILDDTTLPVTLNIFTDRSSDNGFSSGIEVFVGDFTYFGAFGINAPIYANRSLEDRILVANSAVTDASSTIAVVPAVIEFSIDVGELIEGESLPVGLTFSYDGIMFSDIMLGSLYYVERESEDGVVTRKLLMAGLSKTLVSQSSTSSSSSGSGTTLPAEKDKKMELFTGLVKMVDMDSGLAPFQYVSPDGLFPSDAFIDENEYVVVAESTFTPQSGRIVTLDPTGIGDGKVPPIIRLIEGGMFSQVWDVRGLRDDHVFVST